MKPHLIPQISPSLGKQELNVKQAGRSLAREAEARCGWMTGRGGLLVGCAPLAAPPGARCALRCRKVFAQEEQIGAPRWSQAQHDKPLPREAIKS